MSKHLPSCKLIPPASPSLASYAASLILGAILFGLQACGGSSLSTTPPPVTPPHAATFTIIDAPGAETSTPLNGTWPAGINASGTIFGSFIDSAQALHGFLRSPTGTFITFDPPNASFGQRQGTYAESLNSTGISAGYYYGQDGITHGFIRATDATFTIVDIPSGTGGCILTSLNDSGMTTGYSLDAAQAYHGFVRAADGTITNFDVPGASTAAFAGTVPYHIAADGTATGIFYDSILGLHGFIRSPGGMITVLDVPGVGISPHYGTYAVSSNSSGTVIGFAPVIPPNRTQSFFRSSGGAYTVFDPISSLQMSQAYELNDNGAIVGTYLDTSGGSHGYLRKTDGSFVLLDAPNAQQPAGTIAERINASGAIIGYYIDAQKVTHGFLYQ